MFQFSLWPMTCEMSRWKLQFHSWSMIQTFFHVRGTLNFSFQWQQNRYSSDRLCSWNWSSSLCVGHSDVPFCNAAHNLGVIFDSQLAALKEQVNKLCHLAYLEIGRIGSIWQHLSFEATNYLLSSLVLSRLDHCNALLAGSPRVLLDTIQSDQLLSSPHFQSS